jgi:hypothetical protein
MTYDDEMAGSDEAWQDLFKRLEQVRAAWPGGQGWTYDRRFKCVVSSFPASSEEAVLATLKHVFSQSFTSEGLEAAPDPIRTLAGQCGGLRASQRLYFGGAVGEPGAFGLWWPWGDGTTVSLRIGLHDVDAPKERYPRLRDIFGIPQAPPQG